MSSAETKSESATRRARVGTVSSMSGKNTIGVIVDTMVKHPMYGKYVRRRTKLAVHDPENTAGVGDVVQIVPCRRLSKNKSWRLVKIVRRSDAE